MKKKNQKIMHSVFIYVLAQYLGVTQAVFSLYDTSLLLVKQHFFQVINKLSRKSTQKKNQQTTTIKVI